MARCSQPWPVRTGRDIRDPALIRRQRGEVAAQAIGRRGQYRSGGGGPAKAALGARDDPLAAHEARDAMAAGRNALGLELVVDAWRPVRPPAGGVGRPDVHEQGVVALGLAGRRPPRPPVEPAGRDPKYATEAPYAELGAVGGDEVELHFWSSAKYAKAFFRMSRSSVTARRRCWSWRSVRPEARRGHSPDRRWAAPARERVGLPPLEQTPGNAEIMGDLVDGPPAEDEGDSVLLELRRERPTDPARLPGHGAPPRANVLTLLEVLLFGVRSDGPDTGPELRSGAASL